MSCLRQGRCAVWGVSIILAIASGGATAAPTIDEYRRTQDARLDQQWAAGDVDGLLDGVDEILLRLPKEPLARLWLATIIAAEGLPESASAFGADAAKTLPTSAGARALADQQARGLRTIELALSAADGVSLSAADKAMLERGVRGWLGKWATSPEVPRVAPSPRLQRALALAGAMPRGAAVVDVRWQGAALVARVVGGTRLGTIPDLDVNLSSAFAPLFVSGQDLSARPSFALQLQQQVKIVLTGAEPDEQLTISGKDVSVIDGRTAELSLPRRVRVTRRLGARVRDEDIEFVVGQREFPLSSWPELVRARARFSGVWQGEALTVDDAALLRSLCDQGHGAAAEKILDSLFTPEPTTGENRFIALTGLPPTATLRHSDVPIPAVRCRGKSWVGLPRSSDLVVLTLASGRLLTIRAADRRAGERTLNSRVMLTAKDTSFRYRLFGTKEWQPLDVPIDVGPETEELAIDVARPLKALQPPVRLKAAVGEDFNLALAEQETDVRADAVAWSQLQDRRRVGMWLVAVPASLAILGAGSVGGGVVMNGRAQEAAAAYNAAESRADAQAERDRVELRTGVANLLTQIGVATVGAAVAATALPALWLYVWNPDEPSPPEFPTE